jgi:hypothetical protein
MFYKNLKELDKLLNVWVKNVDKNPHLLGDKSVKEKTEKIKLLRPSLQRAIDIEKSKLSEIEQNIIDQSVLALDQVDGSLASTDAAMDIQMLQAMQQSKTVLQTMFTPGKPDIPEPDPKALRLECSDLLRHWSDAQTDAVRAQASFFIENYRHYFVTTAGQRQVSDMNGIVKSYLTSGVSSITGDTTKMFLRNVIGEAVEVGIISLCSGGGAAIGNVPGAVIGFFVGMTVDFLVNKVGTLYWGDATEISEAKLKGKINDYLDNLSKETTSKADKDLAKIRMEIDRWSNELSQITDVAQLTQIKIGLTKRKSAAQKMAIHFKQSNHPLGNKLLKHWVLENIGDDNDDANDWDYNVTESSWKLAVQELKEDGFLDLTENDTGKIRAEMTATIINEELAFLAQVKNELRYTSLNTKSQAFLAFENKVQNYAQQVNGDATLIKEKFNKNTLTFKNRNVVNSEEFLNAIEETYDGNLFDSIGEKVFIERVANQLFSIEYEITITLKEYEKTVVCSWYNYNLKVSTLENREVVSKEFSWQESVDF